MVTLSVLLTFLLLASAPVGAQSGEPPTQKVVHVVQRGETMASLARRYGLTVDALTHVNGLADPRKIYVGQRLDVPVGKSGNIPEETSSYLVQAGDTLVTIAKRYHTTWQSLVRINSLVSPNTVRAGHVIQVPSFSSATTVDKPRSRGQGAIHITRPTETLFRVALHYGVSPWALTIENQIAAPTLSYPGQVLRIPGNGSSFLPEPFTSVDITPPPVAQGEAVAIAVQAKEPVALEGQLFERKVHFAEENGVYYGLVGVHVFAEPGLYELTLKAVNDEGQATELTADVKVQARRFDYEHIDVSGGRASLLDPDVIAADRERLDAVRQTFSQQRHWDGVFERPCAGHISSYFGTHRSYNGSPYTSFHSGTDFRAPTGTPVYAPAAGTVVMAEKLALWGNAVAIDHGWGVLTGFAHLSSIEVDVGQQVAPGELVGRVGNSGLSTGSHLHWEMWVGRTSVNALQWMEGFYSWPAQTSTGEQMK